MKTLYQPSLRGFLLPQNTNQLKDKNMSWLSRVKEAKADDIESFNYVKTTANNSKSFEC